MFYSVGQLSPLLFSAAIGIQMTLKAMESRFWAITAQVGQLLACWHQDQIAQLIDR